MKRLIVSNINEQADAIINKAVLDFYGIDCSDQRDISKLDISTVYGNMQAMKYVVSRKYPDTEEKEVSQYVASIIRFVMHMEPEIALGLTKGEPFLDDCGRVVDKSRVKLTKKYAGSCLPNEELYKVIVRELLIDLEGKFF